jgi:hypothetical protein
MRPNEMTAWTTRSRGTIRQGHPASYGRSIHVYKKSSHVADLFAQRVKIRSGHGKLCPQQRRGVYDQSPLCASAIGRRRRPERSISTASTLWHCGYPGGESIERKKKPRRALFPPDSERPLCSTGELDGALLKVNRRNATLRRETGGASLRIYRGCGRCGGGFRGGDGGGGVGGGGRCWW